MQKTYRYIGIGIFFLAGAAVLVWAAMDANWSITVSVEEFLQKKDSLVAKQVQIWGKVGYIEQRDKQVIFQIDGKEGGSIKLSFEKALPSNFKGGADVLVNCEVGKDGNVKVKSILTKCPSKYQKNAQRV